MTDQNETKTLTLEQRVQRLEDYEEIRQLMVRYAAAMDNNFDANEIASLFTEDAVWTISPATPVTGRHEGREAIGKFFAGLVERIQLDHAQHRQPPDTNRGRWPDGDRHLVPG